MFICLESPKVGHKNHTITSPQVPWRIGWETPLKTMGVAWGCYLHLYIYCCELQALLLIIPKIHEISMNLGFTTLTRVNPGWDMLRPNSQVPSFVSRLDPLHPPLEKLRQGKLPFERPLAPPCFAVAKGMTTTTRHTFYCRSGGAFFELVHPTSTSETYTGPFW